MEYPVSGEISFGTFHATSEQDLRSLHEYLFVQVSQFAANELADLFPSVLVKTYSINLTQTQIDLIHLLLGHMCLKDAFELDQYIQEFVSPAAFEKYERISFNVDPVGCLNLLLD